MKQMISAQKLLRRYQLSKIVVLVFLLVLVGTVAIPGYLTGKWPWTNPPTVTNLKQLKSLRQNGMTLPGWETTRVQNNLLIGGHRWLVEEIKNDRTIAILLLLPQNGPKNQPQVEWLDIDGFHRWQTDSHRTLRFTVKLAPTPDKPPATIEARFFRSWTPQQTFAVVQWYAWPKGGSPSTSRWFWEDSIARLSNRRASWVAVSIILPIEAHTEIEIVEALLESLSQTVQAQLIAETFR
ncbi:cyanoexosortase B system-associated protein [Tychonema sp. LEGE 07203]|uniref:cyanoexosortase B system-associated protein n=1 Tax=Tychonema sp. LEGE 07203 TaxID=1828671 RepID=UPI00187F0615|nr:cyanoexosortase B system-associated protein [Tychonema sp. LEGE 07203]MBE9096397.1 cyanoexosortase B system-associated protein [Tychonema sp. LEGE 07203]